MAFFTKIFVAVALVTLAHVAQTSDAAFDDFNEGFDSADSFHTDHMFEDFQKHFDFKPIDIKAQADEIKNHKPGPNEHFVGFSSSSFSSSSDVNGVKSGTAGSSSLINDNGEVHEKSSVYNLGDPKNGDKGSGTDNGSNEENNAPVHNSLTDEI